MQNSTDLLPRLEFFQEYKRGLKKGEGDFVKN